MADGAQRFLERGNSSFLLYPYTIFDLFQRNIDDILHCYMLATHFDPTWYKAWHTWALANFDVIAHLESQNDNFMNVVPAQKLAAHTVQAMEGLSPRLFTRFF